MDPSRNPFMSPSVSVEKTSGSPGKSIQASIHRLIPPWIHGSIHPSIAPWIHTWLDHSIHRCASPPMDPSIDPSIHHPWIHLSIHPSIHPGAYQFMNQSLQRAIDPSTHGCIHASSHPFVQMGLHAMRGDSHRPSLARWLVPCMEGDCYRHRYMGKACRID